MADLFRAAGKIYHAVIISTSAKLAGVFFRLTFYQNTLHRPDHASTDSLRLLLDFFLQALQPLKFDLMRSRVRQLRGGPARARTVNEAEGPIEVYPLNKLQGGFEIGLRFTRKPDDEIGSK